MPANVATEAEVLAKLKAVFGYTSFRPLQREIVDAILRRKDVFVLMPTGGGKSLCFQLPALLLEGMTVVVSPLIALMKDQVDRLQAMGVPATYLNSTVSADESSRRRAAVMRGEVKLLYVAPERLMMPSMLDFLTTAPPSVFAIDEAHCISEWGHDFRPEYRELRRLRELFPAATFATFTATATTRVQADIVSQLGLQDAPSFRASFNRPNLFYDVRPKQNAYGHLRDYLDGRRSESGIVYCLSRAGTEHLSERLRADGFSAAAYHAGLANDVRRRVQDAFARDDVRIVVATIAFGMGIDKPDVRFVVHYDVPKNIEGYYQESGRAGRDGEPSDCILFYTYGDAIKHEHFIREKESPTEQEVARRQLRAIVDWAEAPACRRRGLLAYFDEELDGEVAHCCDVCESPAEEVDCTAPAQMLLSCAKRTGERFGVVHLIRVLIGSRDKRILEMGHDKLSTYGIGREWSRQQWHAMVNELTRLGYLRLDPGAFNAVKVTALGNDVLFHGRKAVLSLIPASATPVTAVAGDAHADLFDRLRALRKRLADERGVPPYVVFHDTTLRHMAAALPTTPEALAKLQGVGERKLADYGEAFLAEVAAYIRDTGARPWERHPDRAGRRPRAPARPVANDSTRQTVESFKRGLSPPEIAAARGLALSTVQGHLIAAIESGEPLDLDRLVAPNRRRAIEAAVDAEDTQSLRALRDRLGEAYGYDEIRVVVAAWRAAQRGTGG